jgi:hypothetical protein
MRGAPILRRTKAGEKEREILKKAKYVHLVGKKTDERPETKSKLDAKKPSFELKRIIILHPRLVSLYPMLFK